DVYFLVLRAKNVDFRNVGDGKKPGPHPLHKIAQLASCESVCGERIDDAIGVAELVVEEWANNTLRKVLPNIADLLADLIPDVGHISAYDGALEGDENCRCACNRI